MKALSNWALVGALMYVLSAVSNLSGIACFWIAFGFIMGTSIKDAILYSIKEIKAKAKINPKVEGDSFTHVES